MAVLACRATMLLPRGRLIETSGLGRLSYATSSFMKAAVR
jgi:hypothetical protein